MSLKEVGLYYSANKMKGECDMSDQKYPVIDPNDLVGDDDKPVIHKQKGKGMSEQEINAFALLAAAIVNQNKINVRDLLDDFEYFKGIICGNDEDSESE